MRCINCKFDIIEDIKSLASPLLSYTKISRRRNAHVSAVFVLFGDVFPLAKAFTSSSVVSDQCTEKHGRQQAWTHRTLWPTELKLWVLLAINIAYPEAYRSGKYRLNHFYLYYGQEFQCFVILAVVSHVTLLLSLQIVYLCRTFTWRFYFKALL